MIKCPNCGKELPDGARFCDECGSIITMAAQQNAPQMSNTQPSPAQPMSYQAPEMPAAPEVPQAPQMPQANEAPQAPYIPYNGMQPQQPEQMRQPQMAQPQQTPFCQNCGAPSTGTPFCQNCGAPMMPAGNTGKGGKKKTTKKTKTQKNTQKGGKKGLIIGLIAAAVVLIAALVIFLLFGKKGGKKNSDLPTSLFYIVDGEVFYTDLGKDGGYQITDRFIADNSVDKDELYDARYSLSPYFQLTPNGKYLVYGDRVDSSDDGFSIYIRKVGKKDTGAVKMDSNVRGFYISDNSNLITYEKYNAGSYSVYQYDIKKGEKTKLASDVYRWYVSDDGKTIVFDNYEGGLYFLNVGGEKEKLDSDIDEFGFFNDDLKTVWYLKDTALYTRELGKDKTKIDSDVTTVYCVKEDGSFYYVKYEEVEYSLAALMIDDMAAKDANMTEPVAPDYPSSSDYTSDDAYEKALEAYNEAYDAYYDQLMLYWGKGSREYIRENPVSEKVTLDERTLFFYDGKEKTKVIDNLGYMMDYAFDESYMICTVLPSVEDAAAQYSQLYDFDSYTVTNTVKNNQNEMSTLAYIAKSDVQTLNIENAHSMVLSEDGKTLYYIADENEESSTGTLYKLSYGESVGTPIDEDVYMYSVRMMGNKAYYFKDVMTDKSCGELYCDGKQIDFDVYMYGLYYYEELGSVIYYTDYSSNRSEGTLKMEKNGKITVISDDVVQFVVMADGSIVYLYDYSFNAYTGEAFIFKNGKKTKLADDVTCLIH